MPTDVCIMVVFGCQVKHRYCDLLIAHSVGGGSVRAHVFEEHARFSLPPLTNRGVPVFHSLLGVCDVQ